MTPKTSAHQVSQSFTISQTVLKLMSMESVMPSNHVILCYPLLVLPSVFPSIRVFSNQWALHIRCTKYWSFSFSISTSIEYSGLTSFKIGLISLQSKGLSNFLQKIFLHPDTKTPKYSIAHIVVTKIMAPSPITSWQIDGETMKK